MSFTITWLATVVAVLVVTASPASYAQHAKGAHRVGVLIPSSQQWQLDVFRQALQGLGYKGPGDLAIEVRDAGGRLEALSELAMELVRENVDVIVAVNTPGTRAAIKATTIPIVMSAVGDPVATGFVTNLRRPGGNVTGLSTLSCGFRKL